MASLAVGRYRVKLRRSGDKLLARAALRLSPDLVVAAEAEVSRAALRRAAQRLAALQRDGEQLVGAIDRDVALQRFLEWRQDFIKNDPFAYAQMGVDELKQIARNFGVPDLQVTRTARSVENLPGDLEKLGKGILESDVLRKIANTVSDPRFTALVSIVPGLGPAAAAGMAQVGAAYNGLRAKVLYGRGMPDLAAAVQAEGTQLAQAAGLSPDAIATAQQYGASLLERPQELQQLLTLVEAPGSIPAGALPGMLSQGLTAAAAPAVTAQTATAKQAAALLNLWLRQSPTVERFGTAWAPSARVQDAQRAMGVQVTGWVDEPTRAAARRNGYELPPSPAPSFASPAAKAAALLNLWLRQNPSMGNFGMPGAPKRAVSSAQAAMGVAATGYVDAATRAAARRHGYELPARPGGLPDPGSSGSAPPAMPAQAPSYPAATTPYAQSSPYVWQPQAQLYWAPQGQRAQLFYPPLAWPQAAQWSPWPGAQRWPGAQWFPGFGGYWPGAASPGYTRPYA